MVLLDQGADLGHGGDHIRCSISCDDRLVIFKHGVDYRPGGRHRRANAHQLGTVEVLLHPLADGAVLDHRIASVSHQRSPAMELASTLACVGRVIPSRVLAWCSTPLSGSSTADGSFLAPLDSQDQLDVCAIPTTRHHRPPGEQLSLPVVPLESLGHILVFRHRAVSVIQKRRDPRRSPVARPSRRQGRTVLENEPCRRDGDLTRGSCPAHPPRRCAPPPEQRRCTRRTHGRTRSACSCRTRRHRSQ